jgi:1,4-alpha-glucan branching enzyme
MWVLDPRMRCCRFGRGLLATALLLACGDSSLPGSNPPSLGPPVDVDAALTPDAMSAIDATLPDDGTGGASNLDANMAVDADASSSPGLVNLGGNVEPGGVHFRVWAPHASEAWVRGNFSSMDAPMTAVGGGIFDAHVSDAGAGTSYSFVLQTPSGTLVRTDPYCRELGGAGCIVVDPDAYAWTSPPFTRAPRESTVVYEMHVGSFAVPSGAANGGFASTRDALANLADLGVNAIEVMPIQDFGGGAEGWGYNPQLYFPPKASYGTAADFNGLVDAAHGLGIAVLIDTVINHMDSWSQAPLRCFDEDCADASAGIYFFPPGPYATTPWGPRPNYADPNVSAMLVSTVDAWMGEHRADGFRWDSVSNIRALDGTGTTPGGEDVLARVNNTVHARGGLSIAEDLKGYAPITAAVTAGGFGFDAQWDGFGYTIANVLVPAADTGRDLGAVVGALQGTYGGDAFARLLFTEDHDTVGNGGARLPSAIDSANPTSFDARKRSMLAATLLLTAPGVPMLFMGQESLAVGTFTDPPAPLAAPTATGLQVRAFYKDAIRLRRNLDGAAASLSESGVEITHRNDTAKVLGYRRFGPSGEDVLVVVNLMNKGYTGYNVGVADTTPWRIRLNSDLPIYGSDFTGTQTGTVTPTALPTDGKPYAVTLALGPYSAMILSR